MDQESNNKSPEALARFYDDEFVRRNIFPFGRLRESLIQLGFFRRSDVDAVHKTYGAYEVAMRGRTLVNLGKIKKDLRISWTEIHDHLEALAREGFVHNLADDAPSPWPGSSVYAVEAGKKGVLVDKLNEMMRKRRENTMLLQTSRQNTYPQHTYG